MKKEMRDMDRIESTGARGTDALRQRLFKAPNFEAFVEQNAEALSPPPLCDALAELRRTSGLSAAQIVLRSHIARTYLYQLLSGTRKPSRDKLIQLAFGFGLDDEGAQALLKAARMSPLYPRVVRDAAILRCLHERKSIGETQELLGRMGLTALGGEDQYG
jgi:hypothetical protein